MELHREDFKKFVDNETQHFRCIPQPFAPKGLKKEDLVNGLQWFHESEKQSKICNYRKKLSVLFEVSYICIIHIKDEIPSLIFSHDPIELPQLELVYKQIGEKKIEKHELLKATEDVWRRIFSIKAEWLHDFEIGESFNKIDYPILI